MGGQTEAIHGHDFYDEKLGAFLVPIYQMAIFEQPDRMTGETRKTDRGTDLKYSREENPTVRALEHILAKLDGGEDALGFSSGMAAIAAIYMALLRSGSRMVVSKEAYGTTIQLAEDLAKFGVETVLAGPDTEKIVEAIEPGTSLVLIETMTNPCLRIVDVPEVAKRCREVGARLVVDNTFVTPILYRPLKDGVDLVVHSATKYLAGHNDVVAGAVVGSKNLVDDVVWDWRRKLGSILAPFEAFLVIRGLKTLEVRIRRHCGNARAVAEYLSEHPRVAEVMYPGLPDNKYRKTAEKLLRDGLYGGMVSFRVRGGEEAAKKVLRKVRIIKPSPSLGGPESLLTYPIISAAAKMPPEIREELGITEDLLRLSVGLEDVDDIISDLDQALA